MLELLCLVSSLEEQKKKVTNYSKHLLKYAILITQFILSKKLGFGSNNHEKQVRTL